MERSRDHAQDEPSTLLPAQARKGRGAVSNRPGRYEPGDRPREDDGWSGPGCSGADDAALPESADEVLELPPLATKVAPDVSRTVISYNESPDLPFDRSINPYRGCEHGCVYCFARPTHAYLGLSPGLDFETKLFAKYDAAALLGRELTKRGYRAAPMGLGTNTDPYQPIERRLGLTRAVIATLARFNHPLAIVTKSALICRDIDLLAPMAEKGLVQAMISVTTLDPELARKLEPRAPTPERRLEAIAKLAAAGIPTGVMAAPMIPALNDAEMETILAAAKAKGASLASYSMLRLPLEVKELMAEWLAEHAPLKAEHVLSLVRQSRGGKLNDPTFGRRMRGTGPYADLLRQRFKLAIQRLGLNRRSLDLRRDLFAVPPIARAGEARQESAQLSLL